MSGVLGAEAAPPKGTPLGPGVRRWSLMLLLLAMLGGCSPRFVYGWLDWIIPWQVDDYVSLNSAQEGALDKMIERQLRWHRRHELPLYLDHLNSVRRDIEGPLTEQQVLAQMSRASDHWYRLFEHLLPDLVPLIQSLSDEQVEEMLLQIAKEDRELREKYADMTLEQRIKRANKSMNKSLKKWLGPLSPSQKAVIDNYNRNRHSTLELWLAYRADWYTHFSDALRHRADTEKLERELTLLLVTPNELRGERYLEKIQANRQQLARGLIQIHASLSGRQQSKLERKLDDLAEDLEYLIGKD
ncbi:DUF6279 family lipoprotein [Ferrimonas balearica]|uniref:DUF6279 family lipoprotein n=1 Tax=Ferrimonas balearica TaxID=44012 RepID=UPI001C990859|nr:DUF6279 family lipoprotein [Ferrimonas balearica]MBY5991267.1 hypothetical protein [Ferrimonas balearica]